VIESEEFQNHPSKLAFAVGRILPESLWLLILPQCPICLLQGLQVRERAFALTH